MADRTHQDDPSQDTPDDASREKKKEEKRHEKVQEGNTTVDLPPGEEIPSPIGPTSRDTDVTP